MNILFVFNQFPGLGGVETVSDNLISYLGDYFKIFTVSLYSDSSMPLNDKVEKAFLLPEDDSQKAEFYNSLVKDLEISCVINQGIYPVLHPVVFNSDRDRSVKVISVLHGMPGYEKLMFWQKKPGRKRPPSFLSPPAEEERIWQLRWQLFLRPHACPTLPPSRMTTEHGRHPGWCTAGLP